MDLRDQLQNSLGASYTLDRELGGGGMSRVFVADDTRLGRKVVVKVLAPDLAASVSIERFEREIQVAASLQQANIVPVLFAGETDGLPFYTMPFVEGESLRHRLAQSGPLPIADAIRILVDVARALSYAHERGVVHRDIKPDNVLLSGSTAVVTDFGIAKALAASRGGDDVARGETLTMIGTALGTPAYMSPEQAAGDPSIDRRSDIYAFGCLAFELLTGNTPFGGRTPQKMLAAHMAEAPPEVRTERPDVPTSLAGVVMRALAKDPDARPQSAEEVIRDLESAAAEGTRSSAAAPRARIMRTVGIAAAALAGLAALGYASVTGLGAMGIGPAASLRARGAIGAKEPLLIADFRIPGTDTNLANVVTEAVRANLNESNAFTLVAPSRVVAALGHMQRPATTRVDFPLAREIAQREGVKAVVDGSVTPVGAGYAIVLRLSTADSGRDLASFTTMAATPVDLIRSVDEISRKLRGRIGESLKSIHASPALEDVTTASLPALRVFTEADRAMRVGDFPRAVALARQAVAIDSTFADAWNLLTVAGANNGTLPRAAIDSASAMVFRYRDRLPESDRLTVIATYYRTGAGRDRAKATDAYQRMFDRDSSALDAIFVAAMANNRRQFARAESLLVYATKKDSMQSFAFANLAIALLNQGKHARAGEVVATLNRRFPSYQTGGVRFAEYAYQGGDLTAYRRLLDSMRLSPAPRIRSYAFRHLALLDRLGGRLRESEKYQLQQEGLDSATGSPTPPVVDSVRRSMQDAWYLGENARAVRRLDDALRSSPLKAIPDADRPDYDIAQAYAIAGKPDRARAVLRAYVTTADTSIVRDRKPEEHEALGYILLAERKPAQAIAEFRLADQRPDGPRDSNPVRVLAQLGFAFDAANQPDSAIAMFERYKATPFNGHADVDGDARFLAAIDKRLGELYEAKGDRVRAAAAFSEFIGLLKDADPELQPRVAEVRARLRRLRPEGSVP